MKWKQEKTYIYYIPEYDVIYLATYKPEGGPKHGWSPDPWISYREYPDFFAPNDFVNFNPDVVILMNNKTGTVLELKTAFLGEL